MKKMFNILFALMLLVTFSGAKSSFNEILIDMAKGSFSLGGEDIPVVKKIKTTNKHFYATGNLGRIFKIDPVTLKEVLKSPECCYSSDIVIGVQVK